VTLTTRAGQQIHGVKKNEDLFSVQIMDTRERIQGYLKGDMRDVKDDKQSAMPAFGPEKLSESDVNDLLRYLSTLRGFDPEVPQK
jgi:mono/diheme cytochrome c family protein